MIFTFIILGIAIFLFLSDRLRSDLVALLVMLALGLSGILTLLVGLIGVALATSIAFITPLGHPVNVLVMGPGGYKFRDYIKVGFMLTLIIFVVILFFLPKFWSVG